MAEYDELAQGIQQQGSEVSGLATPDDKKDLPQLPDLPITTYPDKSKLTPEDIRLPYAPSDEKIQETIRKEEVRAKREAYQNKKKNERLQEQYYRRSLPWYEQLSWDNIKEDIADVVGFKVEDWKIDSTIPFMPMLSQDPEKAEQAGEMMREAHLKHGTMLEIAKSTAMGDKAARNHKPDPNFDFANYRMEVDAMLSDTSAFPDFKDRLYESKSWAEAQEVHQDAMREIQMIQMYQEAYGEGATAAMIADGMWHGLTYLPDLIAGGGIGAVQTKAVGSVIKGASLASKIGRIGAHAGVGAAEGIAWMDAYSKNSDPLRRDYDPALPAAIGGIFGGGFQAFHEAKRGMQQAQAARAFMDQVEKAPDVDFYSKFYRGELDVDATAEMNARIQENGRLIYEPIDAIVEQVPQIEAPVPIRQIAAPDADYPLLPKFYVEKPVPVAEANLPAIFGSEWEKVVKNLGIDVDVKAGSVRSVEQLTKFNGIFETVRRRNPDMDDDQIRQYVWGELFADGRPNKDRRVFGRKTRSEVSPIQQVIGSMQPEQEGGTNRVVTQYKERRFYNILSEYQLPVRDGKFRDGAANFVLDIDALYKFVSDPLQVKKRKDLGLENTINIVDFAGIMELSQKDLAMLYDRGIFTDVEIPIQEAVEFLKNFNVSKKGPLDNEILVRETPVKYTGSGPEFENGIWKSDIEIRKHPLIDYFQVEDAYNRFVKSHEELYVAKPPVSFEKMQQQLDIFTTRGIVIPEVQKLLGAIFKGKNTQDIPLILYVLDRFSQNPKASFDENVVDYFMNYPRTDSARLLEVHNYNPEVQDALTTLFIRSGQISDNTLQQLENQMLKDHPWYQLDPTIINRTSRKTRIWDSIVFDLEQNNGKGNILSKPSNIAVKNQLMDRVSTISSAYSEFMARIADKMEEFQTFATRILPKMTGQRVSIGSEMQKVAPDLWASIKTAYEDFSRQTNVLSADAILESMLMSDKGAQQFIRRSGHRNYGQMSKETRAAIENFMAFREKNPQAWNMAVSQLGRRRDGDVNFSYGSLQDLAAERIRLKDLETDLDMREWQLQQDLAQDPNNLGIIESLSKVRDRLDEVRNDIQINNRILPNGMDENAFFQLYAEATGEHNLRADKIIRAYQEGIDGPAGTTMFYGGLPFDFKKITDWIKPFMKEGALSLNRVYYGMRPKKQLKLLDDMLRSMYFLEDTYVDPIEKITNFEDFALKINVENETIKNQFKRKASLTDQRSSLPFSYRVDPEEGRYNWFKSLTKKDIDDLSYVTMAIVNDPVIGKEFLEAAKHLPKEVGKATDRILDREALNSEQYITQIANDLYALSFMDTRYAGQELQEKINAFGEGLQQAAKEGFVPDVSPQAFMEEVLGPVIDSRNKYAQRAIISQYYLRYYDIIANSDVAMQGEHGTLVRKFLEKQNMFTPTEILAETFGIPSQDISRTYYNTNYYIPPMMDKPKAFLDYLQSKDYNLSKALTDEGISVSMPPREVMMGITDLENEITSIERKLSKQNLGEAEIEKQIKEFLGPIQDGSLLPKKLHDILVPSSENESWMNLFSRIKDQLGVMKTGELLGMTDEELLRVFMNGDKRNATFRDYVLDINSMLAKSVEDAPTLEARNGAKRVRNFFNLMLGEAEVYPEQSINIVRREFHQIMKNYQIMFAENGFPERVRRNFVMDQVQVMRDQGVDPAAIQMMGKMWTQDLQDVRQRPPQKFQQYYQEVIPQRLNRKDIKALEVDYLEDAKLREFVDGKQYQTYFVDFFNDLQSREKALDALQIDETNPREVAYYHYEKSLLNAKNAVLTEMASLPAKMRESGFGKRSIEINEDYVDLLTKHYKERSKGPRKGMEGRVDILAMFGLPFRLLKYLGEGGIKLLGDALNGAKTFLGKIRASDLKATQTNSATKEMQWWGSWGLDQLEVKKRDLEGKALGSMVKRIRSRRGRTQKSEVGFIRKLGQWAYGSERYSYSDAKKIQYAGETNTDSPVIQQGVVKYKQRKMSEYRDLSYSLKTELEDVVRKMPLPVKKMSDKIDMLNILYDDLVSMGTIVNRRSGLDFLKKQVAQGKMTPDEFDAIVADPAKFEQSIMQVRDRIFTLAKPARIQMIKQRLGLTDVDAELIDQHFTKSINQQERIVEELGGIGEEFDAAFRDPYSNRRLLSSESFRDLNMILPHGSIEQIMFDSIGAIEGGPVTRLGETPNTIQIDDLTRAVISLYSFDRILKGRSDGSSKVGHFTSRRGPYRRMRNDLDIRRLHQLYPQYRNLTQNDVENHIYQFVSQYKDGVTFTLDFDMKHKIQGSTSRRDKSFERLTAQDSRMSDKIQVTTTDVGVDITGEIALKDLGLKDFFGEMDHASGKMLDRYVADEFTSEFNKVLVNEKVLGSDGKQLRFDRTTQLFDYIEDMSDDLIRMGVVKDTKEFKELVKTLRADITGKREFGNSASETAAKLLTKAATAQSSLGFALPAMTEVLTVAFRNIDRLPQFIGLKERVKVLNSEAMVDFIRSAGVGTDGALYRGTGSSRKSVIFDDKSPIYNPSKFNQVPVGQDSRTNVVVNTAEKAFEKQTDVMSTPLNFITKATQTLTYNAFTGRVLDRIAKLDRPVGHVFTPDELSQIIDPKIVAQIGLTEGDFSQIITHLSEGLKNANLAKKNKKGIIEYDLGTLLNDHMPITLKDKWAASTYNWIGQQVVRPDAGDLPIFVDNAFINLLTQFRSFGMAQFSKQIDPLAQRGALLPLITIMGMSGAYAYLRYIAANPEVVNIEERRGNLDILNPFSHEGTYSKGSRAFMDGVLSPMYGPASIGMDLMFMAGLPDPFEWYDSRGGKYNFAEDAARSMAAVRTGVEMADPLVKTAKGQTDKIEWGEWVKRVLGVRSAYNFTEGMVELFDK